MKQLTILDANEKIEFNSIYEAINACVGTSYTGWMKATWPNHKGNGKFRLWFPKLAIEKNGKLMPAAFNCVNTLSSDWNEIVFDDLKGQSGDMSNKFRDYDLIFAMGPEKKYIFRGVFVRDETKSAPNHDVSKRVATKVRLIGSPAYDIELLDEIEEDPIQIPKEPKKAEWRDDVLYITCGNCEKEYKFAERCPHCGQKLKMQSK